LSIENIDRVLGRIKSIEQRINSLSMFYSAEGLPDFTFGSVLERSRLESATDNKVSTPNEEADITGKKAEPVRDRSVSETVELLKQSTVLSNPDSASEITDIIKASSRPKVVKKHQVSKTLNKNPKKIVEYQGFPMQAKVADKFIELEKAIKKEFPGRQVYVTSTMDGQHLSPAHPEGRAIDFVVSHLSRRESLKVQSIAESCGFYVYNEYINGSPYKTGDHMHVELDE